MRFKSCDTCYAHAHFSNKRVIRELRIVSCPGGGVWVAVTREFERDNCVTSEILQSDWTIPNRAGVPRKSTKVPRPSFVRESREGLGPRLIVTRSYVRKLEFCNLISAFTFQYAAILLDQEILRKSPDPFPGGKGLGTRLTCSTLQL